MARLKYGEKEDFEALLGVRTGDVLGFTNRQFREFRYELLGIRCRLSSNRVNYRT